MNELAGKVAIEALWFDRSSHPPLRRSAMINGFGIFTPKFAGNLKTSILTMVLVLPFAVTVPDAGGTAQPRTTPNVSEHRRRDWLRTKQRFERHLRLGAKLPNPYLEKSLSFFADDDNLLSPKSPAVQGKENIRKVWQRMLALPGPGLSFSAARVEVARSGDLAREQGNYEFTMKDINAKTTTEKGTYVTVWKKQPNGAWRVVGDIHNTSE